MWRENTVTKFIREKSGSNLIPDLVWQEILQAALTNSSSLLIEVMCSSKFMKYTIFICDPKLSKVKFKTNKIADEHPRE